MGLFSARTGQPGKLRRRTAVLVALSFTFFSFTCERAHSDAAPAMGLAALLAQLGAAASTAAGTSSIANGNSNVSQGQSTQNQAQMAMGMMQIAMGMLGLLAAAAAAAQSKKGKGNESKMDSTSGYDPNSYQSTIQPGSSGSNNSGTTASTSSSNLDPTNNTVGISPEDLRKGELAASMAAMEKNYGIPRDDFLNALKNGVDPRDILNKAPKNPVAMDTLNRISEGLAANSSSAGDAGRSLASTDSLMNPAGGLAPSSLVDAGASGEVAGGGKMVLPERTTPEEEEDYNKLNVSPEVRAAMMKRAAMLKAERDLKEMSTWSIFQLVHSRYRKVEPMLHGRVERTNPSQSAINGF